MKVEHIPGEGMTFHVTSSDSGEIYEVQMHINRPHGWCSCPDYEYRQTKSQKKTSYPQRCKHICAVVEHLIQRMISEYISLREKAAQENVEEAKVNRERVQAARNSSPPRATQVRPVPGPKLQGPTSHHPKVGCSESGVGTKQPDRPVQRVPQLGSGQPGRRIPTRAPGKVYTMER